MSELTADVIVVGAGNAALCAALAAREYGQRVIVLERAPQDLSGGNTAFAGGGMRVVYDDVSDLTPLMPDVSAADLENSDFGQYTAASFYDDISRVTEYRADPDYAEMLVTRSHQTLKWMTGKGVRFIPSYGRQAFKIGGRQRFWGGTPLEVSGGGAGLVEMLTRTARRVGVEIRYGTRATALRTEHGVVTGVITRIRGDDSLLRGRSVVLACGGFEANAEWRARYLGPGWDLAKVRGTRYNTGDGIAMALDIGALPWGHWSGCHAVGWDLNAPPFGDLRVGHSYNKHHYHLGIMVNASGERFVDEGADIRNFTYAKYGRQIMAQPGQFAWQIFDAKVADLLQKDYYRTREATTVSANTLEDLAAKLDGVDPRRCLATIAEYNKAANSDLPFDPTIKDGKGTSGLMLPKSNWANPIDTPPYEAFAVTCGITFTFGGLRISLAGEVLDTEEQPIPGLFACGELVGGMFYHNYPGGSGLTWGSVSGKAAGSGAAAYSSACTVP